MAEKTASEIREIFGKNLRTLCRRQGSILSAANAIGINRTQLNRFLNGTSFPRPDILNKICIHFDVDARIYTERLSDIESVSAERANYLNDLSGLLLDGMKHDESSSLSPGLYRYWKNSFMFPQHVSMTLLNLFERNGVLNIRGVMYAGLVGKNNFLSSLSIDSLRKPGYANVRGVVFRQPRGLAYLLGAGHQLQPLIFGFVTPSPLFRDIHLGYTAMSQESIPGHNRLSRCVFEKVPETWSAAMKARRNIGLYGVDQVPPSIMNLLLPNECVE